MNNKILNECGEICADISDRVRSIIDRDGAPADLYQRILRAQTQRIGFYGDNDVRQCEVAPGIVLIVASNEYEVNRHLATPDADACNIMAVYEYIDANPIVSPE